MAKVWAVDAIALNFLKLDSIDCSMWVLERLEF